MTCLELYQTTRPAHINVENFRMLHPDGRDLIESWIHRAWNDPEGPYGSKFEKFIFLWIGFNGWGSCVTEKDTDADVIQVLIKDPLLCRRFSELVIRDHGFSRSVANFLALAPIFSVKHLKMRRIPIRWEGQDDRNATIRYYLDRGAVKFDPQCWQRHFESEEPVPPDWPHVLKMTYQVRCNLFHGAKTEHSEIDQQIVNSAFTVLSEFIRSVSVDAF